MDTERWYYRDGQQPVGPFLRERLVELAGAAIVTPDTLVRREGTDDWITLDGVLQAELTTPAPPPIPTVPPASEHAGSPSETSPPDQTTGIEPHLAIPTETGEGDDFVDRKPWMAMPVAPWRRWAARFLDTIIHAFVGSMMISYAWYGVAPISAEAFFAYLETPVGAFVEMMVSGFIAAIVGGVVVGATGSSIGKAIFGVQVLNSDGEPIGIIKGLGREFQVLWSGLGLGLPLISLIALVIAYKRLKRRGATTWDSRNGYFVLHRPNGSFQHFLNVIGIIVIVVVIEAVKRLT